MFISMSTVTHWGAPHFFRLRYINRGRSLSVKMLIFRFCFRKSKNIQREHLESKRQYTTLISRLVCSFKAYLSFQGGIRCTSSTANYDWFNDPSLSKINRSLIVLRFSTWQFASELWLHFGWRRHTQIAKVKVQQNLKWFAIMRSKLAAWIRWN